MSERTAKIPIELSRWIAAHYWPDGALRRTPSPPAGEGQGEGEGEGE